MLNETSKDLRDLDDAYAEWEEAEQKHAHIMSVYAILDTLGDSEQDQRERDYQQKRIKHSPAYFSGHPAYCGERLNAKRGFNAKQYECAIRMMSVLALVRRGGMK